MDAIIRNEGAPCWCPFEKKALQRDAEHFEALAAAVFCARFNLDVVKLRWRFIRTAFAGFDLNAVAGWSDEEADRLLTVAGMIRNLKKIAAILRKRTRAEGEGPDIRKRSGVCAIVPFESIEASCGHRSMGALHRQAVHPMLPSLCRCPDRLTLPFDALHEPLLLCRVVELLGRNSRSGNHG